MCMVPGLDDECIEHCSRRSSHAMKYFVPPVVRTLGTYILYIGTPVEIKKNNKQNTWRKHVPCKSILYLFINTILLVFSIYIVI